MAKAPPRKTETEMSKESPKAPASDTTPEPSAMERMADLTRRILGVPKAEVLKAQKPRKKQRRHE